MISNKTNIKNLILVFAPIVVTMIIQFFVSFVDIIFLQIKNMAFSEGENATFSLEEAYSAPSNLGFITMLQYLIYILVFGLWFYLCTISTKKGKSTSVFSAIKNGINNIPSAEIILCLVIAGYTSQLATDSVLTLLRNHFIELFTNYDKLLESMTGNLASPMVLISVYLLAPIGEEILFRGLILNYSKKVFPPLLSAVLNGLLFGVYHGNMIQGIYAFLFGILLSLIVLHFNSIMPSIILHLTINCSIIFIYDFFFITDLRCITTLCVSLIILTVILRIIFKRKPLPE